MTTRIVLTISALTISLFCQPATSPRPPAMLCDALRDAVISFAAGGFNDLAARLVARHLGRFISGAPNVIVQNMPGGGGIIAANHLYNVATRDGSVIAELDRGIPQAGFRGAPNVKFDVLNFTWLGSLSTYANEACILWVNSNHAVQTVTDLGNPGVRTRLGTITGATDHLLSLISKKVLELNVEVIAGISGRRLDMARYAKRRTRRPDHRNVLGRGAAIRNYCAIMRWRALVQFGRETRMVGYADVPTGRRSSPAIRPRVRWLNFPNCRS